MGERSKERAFVGQCRAGNGANVNDQLGDQ